MKRILFVSPTLQPDAGGIQVSGRQALRGLAAHVREKRLELHHLAYGPNSRSGTIDSALVDYHAATTRVEALLRALRLRSSDAVILFWHVDLLKLYPLIAGSGSTALLCLFGVEAWERFGGLTGWLMGNVDRFLSISAFTRDRFFEHNPKLASRPHSVVHLGIGEPVEGTIPSPEVPPAVLMLGRLSREPRYGKGYEAMIRAWPRVLERHPDGRLWIAGKGRKRAELESLVEELGLGEHVRFWGWVEEEQKQELIRRARCLALPSRGEGFGLVYLEAMRLGRPSLVSSRDAGREVVNPPEAGLEADPADPEALAEAAARLMAAGGEWEAWSRRSRERYENHFTERHFRERLIDRLPL